MRVHAYQNRIAPILRTGALVDLLRKVNQKHPDFRPSTSVKITAPKNPTDSSLPFWKFIAIQIPGRAGVKVTTGLLYPQRQSQRQTLTINEYTASLEVISAGWAYRALADATDATVSPGIIHGALSQHTYILYFKFDSAPHKKSRQCDTY